MSQLHSDTIDGVKTRSGSTGDKHATEPVGAATSQRWSVTAIQALLDLPFTDLIHRAQLVHRQYHDANAV
jgi:biotin synthase